MNWKQIASVGTVGALLLCLLAFWMHRYEYVRQTDGILIRSNKFTGSTEQLVGTSSSWSPVRQPGDDDKQEPDASSQSDGGRANDAPKKPKRTSSSAKDDPPEDLDAEKILMEIDLARRAIRIDSLKSVIDSLQNDGPQMKTRQLSPFEAARSILTKTRAEKLQQKIDSLQSVIADLNSQR